MENSYQTATLAGGCFWCTEAVFKRLKGVISVTSGYTGGTLENPTWEQVCSGKTGHAEAIQVVFNPKVISYDKLLDIFWHIHNPTTLNQQGADIGTEYRSAIFYHDENQKQQAEKSKQDLEKSGVYKQPIVTKIEPFTKFYPAESYHKDYYDQNTSAPYCQIVIDPKVQKLIHDYSSEVKAEYLS